MVDLWRVLGRFIEKIERDMLHATAKVNRAEAKAGLAQLRRDYDRADGFHQGVKTVYENVSETIDIPLAQRAAIHLTQMQWLEKKHDDLLGRAVELFVICQPAKGGRPKGSKKSPHDDYNIASIAAGMMTVDPRVSLSAAVRRLIKIGVADYGYATEASYIKRIGRTLREHKDKIDAALRPLVTHLETKNHRSIICLRQILETGFFVLASRDRQPSSTLMELRQ